MTGITSPAEEYFKDGLWGWDGTQWRKIGLLLGYEDRYAEVESADDVSAGTNTLTFTAVTPGEIWVITAFTADCEQANPSTVLLYAKCDGVYIHLKREAYTVAKTTVEMPTHIVLKAGDQLLVSFYECAEGDDIGASALGYKVAVT